MRIPAFLKRMSVYLLIGSLNKAAAFLLLPYYVRCLAPADVGLLGLLMGMEILLALVLDGSLSQAALRFYFANTHQAGQALLARFYVYGTAFAAAAGVLAFAVLHYGWPRVTDIAPPSAGLLAMVIGSAFFTNQQLFLENACRAQERPRAYAAVSLSRFVLLLVLSIVLVGFCYWGLYGVFAARAFAALAAVLAGSHRILSFALWRVPSPGVRLITVWAFSAPLLLNQLASWSRGVADRYVMANYIDLEQLGIYFTASILAVVAGFVNLSFNQTYEPYYFNNRRNAREGFSGEVLAISQTYLAAVALLMLLLMACAHGIFAWCFPPRYQAAAGIAGFFLVAQFAVAGFQVLIRPLLYHKRTGSIAAITMISAALGLVAIPLLAPSLGLLAGPLALGIGALLALLAIHAAVARIESPDFPMAKALLLLAILAIAALAFSRLEAQSAGLAPRAGVFLAGVIAIAGAAGRRSWNNMIGLFKGKAAARPAPAL